MPEPRTGEVLIRVHASSVNAADYRSLKLGIKATNGVWRGRCGTVVSLGRA
ncbi:MAG: hypothetical protein R2912_10915 [Eubacteriales bacterium]